MSKKYSTRLPSGELFRGSFDTIEQAIKNTINDEDLKVGDHFDLGEIQSYEYNFDADDVIETLAERAYDEVGEAGEDWLASLPEDIVADLNTGLDELINHWLDKHSLKPDFFIVREVETYEVTGPESAELYKDEKSGENV